MNDDTELLDWLEEEFMRPHGSRISIDRVPHTINGVTTFEHVIFTISSQHVRIDGASVRELIRAARDKVKAK